MKIERVELALKVEDYVEVRVFCDGGAAFDVSIEGGVVDEDDLRTMPPDVAAAFVESWPRYLAAKATRTVIVSLATVRPMDDPDLGNDERLFLMPHGQMGMGEARDIDPEAAPPPLGWWPVPYLTLMPPEFDGWDA